MATTHPWPDQALQEQAGRIGPAVFELIDAERRWVHRRVERIELLDSTRVTRSVSTDLTIPTALKNAVALQPAPGSYAATPPRRFVIPLGVLPKAPLEDFETTPANVHRLTADQTNPLIVAALTPYARECGAPAEEVLSFARTIVRSEAPDAAALDRVRELLQSAGSGDLSARERLESLLETLNDSYVLLVAVEAEGGAPIRVTYSHRQAVTTRTGDVTEPPLIAEAHLPQVAASTSPYRVEVLAPEGLEIETASIVAIGGAYSSPVESVNTKRGGGAFVQLRAPDRRPESAGLRVDFGWPGGGIQQVATIAGAASTGALLVATLASYWLGTKMKGASASILLAAPALVTGLALGFTTTPVTSRAVNRLRFAALVVAILGITGALAVSLLAERANRLDALHGILIGCAVLSGLVTAGFPGRAWMRERAAIPEARTVQSQP